MCTCLLGGGPSLLSPFRHFFPVLWITVAGTLSSPFRGPWWAWSALVASGSLFFTQALWTCLPCGYEPTGDELRAGAWRPPAPPPPMWASQAVPRACALAPRLPPSYPACGHSLSCPQCLSTPMSPALTVAIPGSDPGALASPGQRPSPRPHPVPLGCCSQPLPNPRGFCPDCTTARLISVLRVKNRSCSENLMLLMTKVLTTYKVRGQERDKKNKNHIFHQREIPTIVVCIFPGDAFL